MLKFYSFIVCFILSTALYAQELGILGATFSGGVMNYKGDLDDRLSMRFLRPAAGVRFSALPWPNITVAFSYVHGRIECDDAKANISRNKFRNLKFFSDIDEINALFIYRLERKLTSFRKRPTFTPYLFAGIGYFHFNPKTEYNDKIYELQKVGTEGQHMLEKGYHYPDPYKLWQFAIPFGTGLNVKLHSKLDIGCEMGLRKTFTDYLDDVSGKYLDKVQLGFEQGEDAVSLSDRSNDPNRPQGKNSFARRGRPDKKDWYIYTNITVTFYITTRAFISRPTF